MSALAPHGTARSPPTSGPTRASDGRSTRPCPPSPRLALRAAALAADNFRDGASLVDLSGVREAAAIGARVAACLGVPGQDQGASLTDVIGYLRGRELLLVLDGCDQVAAASADFARTAVAETSGVTVLATSRQPLSLGGEHCVRVPPFPVPDARRGAADGDAADLFEQRVAVAVPGFTPNSGCKIGIAFTLEVLGPLSARSGKHKRTAWLLGAAGRLWDEAGSRLGGAATLEAMHQDAKHEALAALTGRRFDGIQAMGADSPLNEVIAFAIGDVSIQVS